MTKSSLLGDGLLVIWGEVNGTTTDEEALNDWWTNEHLPERLSIDGFRRARRYHAADDSSPNLSRYLVCYEVASLETLTSKDYMDKLNDPTLGTAKYMPLLTTMERQACKVVHSAGRIEFSSCKGGMVGATIAHIVLTFPSLSPQQDQDLDEWVVNTLSPSVLSSHHSVLAFHALRPDETATSAGNASKSYDAVRLPERTSSEANQRIRKMILLVEFSYTKSAVTSQSRTPMLKASLMEYLNTLEVKVASNQLYSLLCVANE